MAATSQAPAPPRRALTWDGLALRVTGPGWRRSRQLDSFSDVTEAMRSAVIDGPDLPAAGALACLLAARTLLGANPYGAYTQLLAAARAVQGAAPGDRGLDEAVRSMLAAADRADGPTNGAARVIAEMEAEAARLCPGLISH